jgi:hypothetical protein
MLAHKSFARTNILCGLCKEDKKRCHVKDYFEAQENFIFAHVPKKINKISNFVCEHRISHSFFLRQSQICTTMFFPLRKVTIYYPKPDLTRKFLQAKKKKREGKYLKTPSFYTARRPRFRKFIARKKLVLRRVGI